MTPFVPRAPRERELLARLAADPELRQVYGDWLEENGFRDDAEMLALDAKATPPLKRRLQIVAARTDRAWRAAVTTAPIRGCEEAECPRSWARLAHGPDASIRRCEPCAKDVRFADSLEEIERCIAERRRFVIDPRVWPPGEKWTEPHRRPHYPIRRELPFLHYNFRVTDVPALFGSLGISTPMPAEGPLTPYIERVTVDHRADNSCTSFTIEFRSNADAVAAALQERGAGASFEVVAPDGRVYHVYGGAHWLLRRHGDPEGGCTVRWEASPPAWLVPPGNPAATLDFFTTLAAALREGISNDALQELASRPPADACFQGVGPTDGDGFAFDVEPQLPVLDVLRALGVEHPIAARYDERLEILHVYTLTADGKQEYPRLGPWSVVLQIADWTSEKDIGEERFAISAADRTDFIVVGRPEP